MDPKFLEAHWAELPNLNAFRREGEFKRLRTTMPPQSPVAWATFITGTDPTAHGIYDFVHRNPRTLLPFSSLGEAEPSRHTIPLGAFQIPLARPRFGPSCAAGHFGKAWSAAEFPLRCCACR